MVVRKPVTQEDIVQMDYGMKLIEPVVRMIKVGSLSLMSLKGIS